METALLSGGILILLFLSAFFSGSETALTASSRAQLHRLEEEGNWRAAIVNKLRLNREKMIGGILLGNNLVNILASALATSLLIDLFGKGGVVYATLIMTLLILIFSEVIPKSYALYHATSAALFIGPIMRPIIIFFSPFLYFINLVVKFSLNILGIKLEEQYSYAGNEEELRGAIDLHKGADPEINQERVMLRSILDLGDVDVSEIMVHRKDVFMINADDEYEDLMTQIFDSPYTRIPIWEEKPENIIGVLHVKDILRTMRSLQNEDDQLVKLEVKDLASSPWFIPESTSLLDQLQAFRRRHEHFSLVVDEYGSFLGIVTLEDILEEIVGDISDEHDVALPSGVRPQSDGTYVIEGTVTIRDLNREFEWKLPDDEASTLAGLILHEARIIPQVGQRFQYFGFRFEIIKRQRNQITLVKVVPPVDNDED